MSFESYELATSTNIQLFQLNRFQIQGIEIPFRSSRDRPRQSQNDAKPVAFGLAYECKWYARTNRP
jgi:hypothetical protein